MYIALTLSVAVTITEVTREGGQLFAGFRRVVRSLPAAVLLVSGKKKRKYSINIIIIILKIMV